MKVTQNNRLDLELKATRWLNEIPKEFLSRNNIHIYGSDTLLGFLSDFYSAPIDDSFIHDSETRFHCFMYYHLLVGMAETCYELNGTLAYDPEKWICKIL